jgi:hypothetical protein
LTGWREELVPLLFEPAEDRAAAILLDAEDLPDFAFLLEAALGLDYFLLFGG